jgi:hypothetical protein
MPTKNAIYLMLIVLAALSCREKSTPGQQISDAARPLARAAIYDVVLVEPNDQLNVRADANPNAAIVDRLSYDAPLIESTGAVKMVGAQRWLEIKAAKGNGWVNSNFLTEHVEAGAFASDPRPKQLLAELARALVANGDLSKLIAPRGLYVHHYAPAIHFSAEEAAKLAADTEKRKWNGPACGEACLEGTFAEIIGNKLAATINQSTSKIGVDQRLKGGNASTTDPASLTNFHFLSVFDQGTQDVDWASFAIYFDYVENNPRIIAILPDAWSP